jgi:3-oxoacyl-[acyl-carrier protein] reductase
VDLQLTGQVAVVTAASKGIGAAIAAALAAEGAALVICARDEAAITAAAGQIAAAAGTEVIGVAADVSGPPGRTWRPAGGAGSSTSSRPP